MNKNPKEFSCFIQDRKCHKCGKLFIPGAEHIYKDHSKWYCCWTCYLHRKDKYIAPKPIRQIDEGQFIIPEKAPWPKENPLNKTKED